MSEMSKEKINDSSKDSHLICVTGFMGNGKSSVIDIIKKIGFQTFVADEFVHSIYNVGQIGYQTIKENFGKDYVNQEAVDRNKLRELILSDNDKKFLLEKLMNQLIYEKISSLKQLNCLIFVELGTYLFFEDYFKDLFEKVIVVDSHNKSFKKNNFKKFSSIKKFSTKPVGNLEITKNNGVFYADFIVGNDGNLQDLERKVKDLIKNFKHL